jgi:hypothetical protein
MPQIMCRQEELSKVNDCHGSRGAPPGAGIHKATPHASLERELRTKGPLRTSQPHQTARRRMGAESSGRYKESSAGAACWNRAHA